MSTEAAYQAQQSLNCHSAHFLCLPSYGTTPDKTHFYPVMLSILCKFYAILSDIAVVKEF